MRIRTHTVIATGVEGVPVTVEVTGATGPAGLAVTGIA